MLTYKSATDMAEFTIRYIGDEYEVKDVHYQFSGQEFEANGYEETWETRNEISNMLQALSF